MRAAADLLLLQLRVEPGRHALVMEAVPAALARHLLALLEGVQAHHALRPAAAAVYVRHFGDERRQVLFAQRALVDA